MCAAMYTRAGSEELDLVECDFHYLEEDGREKRSYGSAAPWNKLIRRRLLYGQRYMVSRRGISMRTPLST